MKHVAPALQPLLEQMNIAIAQAKADNVVMTPQLVRENLNKLAAFTGQGPQLAQVCDSKLHDIPVRVYVAENKKSPAVIVYFHGGGHMCGSVELYDPICRRIAKASGAVVISVEYRLAPEHSYPAGIDDGYQICCHYPQLLNQLSISHNNQLIVAGDSAGGAIASQLALRSQDDPALEIAHQILIYPSLDYSFSSDSYRELGQGYLLETAKIKWYFSQYFQHDEDPIAVSPLFSKVGAQLPPATIFCAGFDPLRDEAHRYAEKLTAAGVQCQLHQFDQMIHAFINLHDLVPQQCQQLYSMIGDAIKELTTHQSI